MVAFLACRAVATGVGNLRVLLILIENFIIFSIAIGAKNIGRMTSFKFPFLSSTARSA